MECQSKNGEQRNQTIKRLKTNKSKPFKIVLTRKNVNDLMLTYRKNVIDLILNGMPIQKFPSKGNKQIG